MAWIIKTNWGYGDIGETHCESAEEVVQTIASYSAYTLDNTSIEPAPQRSYEPYEFINAFENGKVV